MQPLLGMGFVRVVDQRSVGENQRVGSGGHGVVDAALPQIDRTGAHKSVQRDQDLDAALMGVDDALAHLGAVEIEAGEIAGVGFVAEAAIDRMSAGIDGRAQAGRRSCRTDQLRNARGRARHHGE